MKKSRYTEEQIAFALRQAEAGTPIVEVFGKKGIPPRGGELRDSMRASSQWKFDAALVLSGSCALRADRAIIEL